MRTLFKERKLIKGGIYMRKYGRFLQYLVKKSFSKVEKLRTNIGNLFCTYIPLYIPK